MTTPENAAGLPEQIAADRQANGAERAERLAAALSDPGGDLEADDAAGERQALREAIDATEDPGPEAVGDRTLRQALRESYGIGLRQLAEVLGVSVAVVTRAETIDGGKSDPFTGQKYRAALAIFAQNAAEKGGA